MKLVVEIANGQSAEAATSELRELFGKTLLRVTESGRSGPDLQWWPRPGKGISAAVPGEPLLK